jgi:hypothetical protein
MRSTLVHIEVTVSAKYGERFQKFCVLSTKCLSQRQQIKRHSNV